MHATYVLEHASDDATLQIEPGEVISFTVEDLLCIIGRGDWAEADFDALIDNFETSGTSLDDMCLGAWDHSSDGEWDVWLIYTAHVCDTDCEGATVV